MAGQTRDGGGTVLVAEDESELATLYRLWLADRCVVREAADGEAALAELSGESVDLAVLDRGLPELSGDDVVSAARRRGIDTPVIFVSAWSPVDRPPSVSCVAYLVKPVGREALVTAVERVLASRG